MSAVTEALRRAEAAPRPELPLTGFRLVRRATDDWPVVLDRQGRFLCAPDARVHRASAADGGSLLALEIADDASEVGRLVLVDRTGRIRPVATPPLRYGDQLWVGPELHLLDRDGRWLVVDSRAGSPRAGSPRSDAVGGTNGRPRLLAVGGEVALAVTGAGDATRLEDRDGRTLLELPPLRAASSVGGRTLAVTDEGLLLLAVTKAGIGVQAEARLDPVTDGTPVHATASPDGAAVHLVRDGHSRLLTLDDALRPVTGSALSSAADVTTITGLSWADGTLWLRHEAPARSPQLCRADDLASMPGGPGGPGDTAPPARLLTVAADDGTPIELVVTGEAAGPAPLLLEVYGGFGVVDLPSFEPSVAAWCALGGLHVTARIRGGGGRGSSWHEQARGARKARAVADTVAVARALVEWGLTAAEQLVIAGASHGGLVAASAVLAAPGVAAGAACTAAPLDPHRISEHPLGELWTAEFGDPQDPAVRAAMDDYAPLRRLTRWPAGAPLPRFLLTTFAADTRVAPAATDRLADALTTRGAHVVRRHRPAMGHGRNARSGVHAFAASVLTFALDPTGAP